MNIYLDIDGTILDPHMTLDKQEPVGLKDFLQVIVDNHTPYWLTTHSRDGSTEHLYEYLSHRVSSEVFELCRKIKPATWDFMKTEGIDFSQPFLWFDDTLLEGEREILEKNDALNNYVKVDLKSNPQHILTFFTKLLV